MIWGDPGRLAPICGRRGKGKGVNVQVMSLLGAPFGAAAALRCTPPMLSNDWRRPADFFFNFVISVTTILHSCFDELAHGFHVACCHCHASSPTSLC